MCGSGKRVGGITAALDETRPGRWNVPRAIWKGSISFGLVNAPVAMYAAIDEQDLRFHMIHTKDDSPIGYDKVCKKEGKHVPDSQIARAYELEDGSMVVLEESDFEAAKADGYHAITVLDFVGYDDIDPIYFERTFYLGPADEGAAAHVYALLSKAMEESGLAAICSYIFHSREQLGCLRVQDGVLFLEKMYFANEIRDSASAKPKRQRINAGELKAARQLIDSMAGTFRPEQYEDSYRAALLRVIRKKAKGEKITVPEPEQPAQAPDLMAALEESLKASSKHTRRPRKKARAAK
jgi:DNA end-binding protein Ku